MIDRKRGSILFFFTITIFLFIAVSIVSMVLPVAFSIERIGKNYLDGAISSSVLASAKSILEFSASSSESVSVSINDARIISFIDDGLWCVSIEDDNSTRIIYSERR